MFRLFKQSINQPQHQQTQLLDENQLRDLRILAEQLDCSATPAQTLNTRQTGNLPTHALGGGIDYAESRIYQAGDDPRSINWRLSARSQETFVKTYHIESRPNISVFFDKRRSMIFGTKSRLKVTQALRVATTLAYAALLHNIDFQAWVLSDELEYFDDVDAFLLNTNQPVSTYQKTSETLIHQSLQTINQRSSTGSLVYLISDFEGVNNTHQAELAHLHERCFVQAIHIFDRAELSLPTLGKIRLQALHQTRSFQIDTHENKQQEAFLQIANDHFNEKRSLITDLGIPYSKLATEDESFQHSISLPLGQP